MLPSIFISHGSPSLILSNNRSKKFLSSLPSLFDKPKYILVISAHWTTNTLEILTRSDSALIYDFYGFPEELYNQKYPANSDVKKENEIIDLLTQHNISIKKNNTRAGYDHGVWSPLALMYPKADIPVIQLSLPMSFSTQKLFDLGKVLYPLRKDTLILSSGSLTHNLGLFEFSNEDAKVHNYAKDFHDWMTEKIENGEQENVLNYESKAPFVRKNHPTLEHLLPLFVSYGASDDHIGKSLHDVYMYGSLSMEAIIFKN